MQFQIDDLSYPNSKFIFILESPHYHELEVGYPAAGDTGMNMSRVLFKLEKPLGELIRNRIELPVQLSLLNCSRIPLQKSCYNEIQLTADLVNFLIIQEIYDPSIQIQKTRIKEKLRSETGLKAVNSFKARLLASLAVSKDAKLVVCGVIAQCFFEEVTQLRCRFRSPENISWSGLSFSVFYEYHPSSKLGRWDDRSEMNALLTYVS